MSNRARIAASIAAGGFVLVMLLAAGHWIGKQVDRHYWPSQDQAMQGLAHVFRSDHRAHGHADHIGVEWTSDTIVVTVVHPLDDAADRRLRAVLANLCPGDEQGAFMLYYAALSRLDDYRAMTDHYGAYVNFYPDYAGGMAYLIVKSRSYQAD